MCPDQLRYTCPDCGTLLVRGRSAHTCSPALVVAHQARSFDSAFRRFLDSPPGRFAVYYARRRLGGEP